MDSIVIDGKEIEMTAKNYTSTDDGVVTRTNLYNSWVSEPSQDARTIDGALYDADGNALDICSEYSAQVVNVDDFKSWTKVEVNFTVSGMDGDAAPAEDGDADTEADDAAADDAADDAADEDEAAE